MQAKRRLEWVDAAKGISILLVTLLHCTMLSEAAGLGVARAIQVNDFLSPIRMPLFFFVSGLLANSVINGRIETIFRRKVFLFLWLLVIWSVIRFLWVAFVVKNPDNLQEGSDWGQLLLILVRPDTGIWFLWSLAIFFPLTKILNAANVYAGAALCIFASVLANGFIGAEIWPDVEASVRPMAYQNSLKYFVFFYIAASFPGLRRTVDGINPGLNTVALAAVYLMLYLAQSFARDIPLALGMIKLTQSLIGVYLLLLLSKFLTKFGIISPILQYLGKNTLAIYVAQVPVISVLVYLFLPVGQGAGPLANFIPYLMTPLVVSATLALQFALLRVGADWLYDLPRRWRFRKEYDAPSPVAA
ncbi:conserved hypothetical membrane protein [Sphingobium sp. SYK-6]|uniref:acyltransferase family protein n=1 Tax=Sphingobium sp. (strain NBRC 103272 / SYK-6) TaxID=627192 RepID=UPI00022771EF|nr:acyltransferase family protein [Sphingobium sp. SYK-6]BAK67579.1 conserved hypothetical membrane protein [Sphingobium sp. SYK-6]